MSVFSIKQSLARKNYWGETTIFKMKWLLFTLWIALIFKEIAWLVVGLEFWRQSGLGVIISFGLPITIIILALLNFSYGAMGLRNPEIRKLSIVTILSALICSSLAMIGLWGVISGVR
jgi:hypothetical protein